MKAINPKLKEHQSRNIYSIDCNCEYKHDYNYSYCFADNLFSFRPTNFAPFSFYTFKICFYSFYECFNS